MPPETPVVWWQMLEDLDTDDAQLALSFHVKQSKFPPTVADIRERVAEISEHRAIERATIEQHQYFSEEETLTPERRQELVERSRAMLKRLSETRSA